MSKQNGKETKQEFWVRMMCLFLGALMVLGIVVMVISTFPSMTSHGIESRASEQYTVTTDEISVGLCFASSAVQNYTLSSDSPMSIKNKNFTVAEGVKTLNIAVDDNLYSYNGSVTDNPIGVGVIGAYNVRLSFIQSNGGTSSSDKDNPVFILPGVSAGGSGDSIFTKDNINEYIQQFNSSKTAEKLGVYAFATNVDGKFYMSVGALTSEDLAMDLMTELQEDFALNGEIAAPQKDIITVLDEDYRVLFETDDSTDLEIHPTSDSPIRGKGNSYNGYFRFYRDNGKEHPALQVINSLPIDSYVKSVMSVELNDSYSAEMLKASAVIFRTSAYKRLVDNKLREFDVCASSHCQTYSGCASVSSRISEAVDAVKGEVIVHDSELIYPVYTASSGSTTVSLADAAGKELDYLKSLQTNWEMVDSVYADWKNGVSPAELKEMLDSAGYSGLESRVKTITIDERSENSLYVTKITFSDVLGNSVSIQGSENIRHVLSGVIESAAFIVGKSGSTVEYSYYAENGELVEGKQKLEGVVGNFIFSGEGQGSGVGLSMKGAEVLAKQGKKYAEILLAYYSGVLVADTKLK